MTGQETLKGNKTTFTAIKNQLAQYLVSSQGANAVSSATASVAAIPSPSSATKVTVAPITKVFTGIVSQGVVGQGLVFEARPSDLITSLSELQSAAANNLAPFLNTLLGKIVYEVKVVSSVISKDGFKQSGTVQKIQTGTTKAGVPTYKTVVNKFATLVVYALTDKGSRAKLTTIVLGPTDSASLTVGQNDLQALQNSLPSIVTTTDIKDITGIQTTTPIAITPPTTTTPVASSMQAPAAVTTGTWWVWFNFGGTSFQRGPFDSQASARAQGTDIYAKYDPGVTSVITFNTVQGNPGKQVDPRWNSTSVPASAPVVSSVGTGSTKPGANATTLSEWYSAHGWALPTVQIRATLYQDFGLGQASYYTGTAEQNTNLLNALKAQ